LMGLFASVVVGFTFLINLLLGFTAYNNNPKSWTNRLLAILTVILASWTIFNFFALLPGNEATRLFWVRIVMLVTSPMGAVTYLLASIFPKDKFSVSNKKLSVIYAIVLVTAVMSMSPWMFTSLKNLPNENFSLTPGPAIALFAVSHLGLTTLAFIVLIKKFRQSKGRLRFQFLLFLLGNIFTFTLITVSNFVAVVFLGTIQYTFIGPTFTLFLAGFITYAIVKHRFLDIRLFVVRSVTYALLIIVLAFIYAYGFYVIGQLLLPVHSEISEFLITTFLALVMAFSFQPLRRFIQRITKQYI